MLRGSGMLRSHYVPVTVFDVAYQKLQYYNFIVKNDIISLSVDPLRGHFAPGLGFERRYGAEDIRPLSVAIGNIVPMLHDFRSRQILTILCTSLFPPGARDKVRMEGFLKLEDIAGRIPAVDSELFDHIVTKHSDYPLSVPALQGLARDCSRFIVSGVTVTCCVRNTVEALLRLPHPPQIILPRDVLGARAKRMDRAQQYFDEWEDRGVTVLHSWRELDGVCPSSIHIE